MQPPLKLTIFKELRQRWQQKIYCSRLMILSCNKNLRLNMLKIISDCNIAMFLRAISVGATKHSADTLKK